ncbi:MAG TPA: glycosyltransferase family 4 protein [Solirubrobacteraceae bacterium]|nr:glycosyltransferase family 4 protein [Solirubrobacteraceae bacterium]
MRILIFHGYLLAGTGSNVYNARLAAAFVRQGHEVHLLCQDRHPERQPFVDVVADWDGGRLQLREIARARALEGGEPGAVSGGSCTVYRPDIGGLLPVYVADRYEGLRARTFAECSEAEVEAYLGANVAAVREIAALVSPDVALANHLVMGPAILARALEGKVPYAVKVHGSALEYTVKPEPERFLPYAREGLREARGILVGSNHTATSLWEAFADAEVERRTRLGPPGVDVERFAPRERPEAAAALAALAARLRGVGEDEEASPSGDTPKAADGDAFARDERAAGTALARLDLDRDRPVAFVGKLIVSKGVDLLLAAWPLVLEDVPDARLVVVGFGAYRAGLERLRDALREGDLERAREIARAGRSLEADPELASPPAEAKPLRHLLAFLDRLHGAERERYVAAARALGERALLTGRLEHDELAELLPACEALVVPSTFPEAFGMVAAEGAACGALPVSAAHSGLAEVSEALARAVPAAAAGLLSFPVDDGAVPAIAQRLVGWLTAEPSLREETRAGLVETVRERWSWDGVARNVVAAARGRLEGLALP